MDLDILENMVFTFFLMPLLLSHTVRISFPCLTLKWNTGRMSKLLRVTFQTRKQGYNKPSRVERTELSHRDQGPPRWLDVVFLLDDFSFPCPPLNRLNYFPSPQFNLIFSAGDKI